MAMQLAAAEMPEDGIDFADMIFLPVRNRWTSPTFDLIVVDEAQDMTKAQLAVALGSLRKGGRVCVVGDDRQAIYGFRGADSGSIDRLKKELNAKELRLTTTYRCGKRIVAAAQVLVPDFQAGPNNHDGEVLACNADELVQKAEHGDFVLSRTNAPLVPTALGFLLAGKRCKIAGRDIGAGLKKIVRRIITPGMGLEGFVEGVKVWADREVLRLKAKGRSDAAIDLVRDKQDMLVAMTDGVDSVEAVVTRIDALFSDSGLGAAGVITLSSVHRAKGLEAERVFVLEWTLYPRGEASPEECNIHYVALTRAKRQLTMVTR
jgi:DNA helicase-2/ATP-dependent DNA helicase PcrA